MRFGGVVSVLWSSGVFACTLDTRRTLVLFCFDTQNTFVPVLFEFCFFVPAVIKGKDLASAPHPYAVPRSPPSPFFCRRHHSVALLIACAGTDFGEARGSANRRASAPPGAGGPASGFQGSLGKAIGISGRKQAA